MIKLGLFVLCISLSISLLYPIYKDFKEKLSLKNKEFKSKNDEILSDLNYWDIKKEKANVKTSIFDNLK